MAYEFIFRGKQPHKGAIARTRGGILLAAVPLYSGAQHPDFVNVITIDQIAQQFDLEEILGTFCSYEVDSTVIVLTRQARAEGDKNHPILNPIHLAPFEKILMHSYKGNRIRYA